MTYPAHTTFLMVPGLRGHVADHWQTHLAASLDNARTVPPMEHDGLSRTARVAALDAAVAAIDGPVVLVAHSAGTMIVAHWAASDSPHLRKIAGALLATPADLAHPLPDGYPRMETLAARGWLPIPRRTLPFPTLLAASRNDPLADYDVVAGLAVAWGSQLVDLGRVGHLNPASGYGPWPRAKQLLGDLSRLLA